MQISFEAFIFYFLCSGLGAIVLAWFYFDVRERNLYSYKRVLHTFHCVKCGHVYGAKQSRTVANCPKCRFRNSKLSF